MTDEGADLTNGPSTSKGKKRSVAAPSPRSPQIKRKRMPAEYYQSDVVDAISKQSTRTPSSDKEVFFNKNTYLAVRTDNGKFFICKTAQNVYHTTKMFKIMWLELRTAPGTYEMSYRDTIDIDSVLTDVVMNRQAGGLLSLPRSEIIRVERILGLAIKKENGTLDSDIVVTPKGPRFREMKELKNDKDEDDEEDEEDDEDDDDDYDDDDDDDKEDKSEKPSTSAKTRKATKAKKPSPKKPKPKAKAGSTSPHSTSPAGKPKGRGRPKASVATKTAIKKAAKKITAKAKSTKGKAAAKTTKKSGRKPATKGKKTAKDKAKKEKKPKPKKEKKPKEKLHPNDKLKPNPNIEVVTKDPMFEIKNENEIPEVSKFVQCKRSIRAVLTNDMNLLKKLIESKDIPSVFQPRSPWVPLTALDYAARTDNQAALKLLIPEIKGNRQRAKLPEVIMEHQSTGRYNFKSLGHAVREINVGRGSREGNSAFTKDMSPIHQQLLRNYIDEALATGVSSKTIDMIMVTDKSGEVIVSRGIIKAILAGHRKLAGYLIEKFNRHGSINCNKLHEEVLLADKPEDLSPFRAVSAKKKPYENDRVTPIHCAAINPNPKILAKLLSICPEYGIADHRGRKPIHYAAACEGSGPLEFLLSRGLNPDDTDNKAMTPLMVAALYGRQQNIEVLLKKIESVKTDELCGVKRKSATAEYAIHYAAKAGHVECVKSLIKHGADLEAMMSASTQKLTPLMVAAQNGHFQVAKALIEAKAIITKRDKIKRTSLMLACINGHYPVATLLLRKGADPNAKDSSGNTAVHYAAAYGWWHCLKLLLKAGGDPNILNDWKTPPLGIALMKGHIGCADLLLEQPGVSLNFRDNSGANLVMLTAGSPMTKYMVDQMKYLINKKADLTSVDIENRNALHYLAAGGMPEGGNDAEREAQKNAILDVAKLLMDKGCDASVKDKAGNTPINIALQQTNFCVELVQLFMNRGCSLSLDVAEDGDNALHVMADHCSYNNLGILLPIIAKMCDKQAPEEPMEVDGDSKKPVKRKKVATLEEAAKVMDGKGRTPLLRCIIANSQPTQAFRKHSARTRSVLVKPGKKSENVLSMLKALIEVAKSDVNAVVKIRQDVEERQYEGASPLHLMSLANNVPALIVLLKAKPQLDALDKGGFTPLQRAILHKRQASSKMLIEAGANVNLYTANKHGDKATPLILAAMAGLHDLIPILVAKGADVKAKDSKTERTALHYITLTADDVNKNLQTSKVLLQAGASVNAVDAKQRTPLHYAVNADTGSADTPPEFTEFLIEKKANVFVRDMRGRLPLHYAFVKINNHRDKTRTDPIEIVTVLLEAMKGQQVDTQDKFGQTPLHWAAYRGSTISSMHIAERIKDYNVKDNNSNTPLVMAALGGHDSVAIMLIQKGANTNTVLTMVQPELEDKKESDTKPRFWQWKPTIKPPITPFKTTFFEAVVSHGWQGVIYLMMDRLQKFGLSHFNIIEYLLEFPKFKLASIMIRKQRDSQKLQQTNRRARTLLHLLAMSAVSTAWDNLHEQIAKALFDCGVKLYARDDKGCTPLHYAAVNQNVVLCKLFAERDPNGFKSCLNCSDHRGRTPVAAIFWNLRFDSATEEVIRLLVKSNDGLNLRAQLPNVDCNSTRHETKVTSLEVWYHGRLDRSAPRTPLILHMYLNNFQACRFLLKNGASCNYADENGLTPLMHAVKLNDNDLVKLLADHDFDPEKDGKKKKLKKQEPLSVWAANVWEQKKSGTQEEQQNEEEEEEDEDEDEDSEDEDVESDEDEDPEEKAERKAKQEAKKKRKEAMNQKFVKTSDLNVNAVDSMGRAAVHHAAKTCSYGTWENEELLELLVQLGAKTTMTDKQGNTPLDLTMETRSKKMAKALQRLQGIKETNWVFPKPATHSWTDGITFTSPKPDYEANSQAMLKQIEANKKTDKIEKKEEKLSAVVDPASDIKEGGVVLIDEQQDIPYSVTLTKVDIKYGRWGMNNYYVMQIIHQTGKDMMLLFTRWGRIGDAGQFQKTPFTTKVEAIKEFQKIFKAKTGNDWSNVKNFQKEPKKYQLVREDHWRAKRKKAIKEFKFNLESPVPSKLPPALQAAMKELIKPDLLTKALSESGVDTTLVNLGNFISRDTLQKAQDILNQISELLEKNEEAQKQQFADTEKQQAAMEEICGLSSDYFELIPNKNFSHDKISPLTDEDQLSTHMRRLDILLDLSTTNMILLGAQYRVKDINPLDYVYRSLDCQIRLMKEDDQETQLILQYIHKTVAKNANVEAIFRLSRGGEDEEFSSCGVEENHKLLWHGSSRSNVISILRQGLLIAPSESERIGERFGRGIYSSDAFAKSVMYCGDYFEESDTKFMFLCEVALGKMAVNPEDPRKAIKQGSDSVLGNGYHKYKYNRDLLMPSGAVMPLGKFVVNHQKYCYFDYNEFIVYKKNQVSLRYLVQCKGTSDKKKEEILYADDYSVQEYKEDNAGDNDDNRDDDDDDDEDEDDDDC